MYTTLIETSFGLEERHRIQFLQDFFLREPLELRIVAFRISMEYIPSYTFWSKKQEVQPLVKFP
jgi:hypothetical protein